jgi:hypothetical protein
MLNVERGKRRKERDEGNAASWLEDGRGGSSVEGEEGGNARGNLTTKRRSHAPQAVII